MSVHERIVNGSWGGRLYRSDARHRHKREGKKRTHGEGQATYSRLFGGVNMESQRRICKKRQERVAGRRVEGCRWPLGLWTVVFGEVTNRNDDGSGAARWTRSLYVSDDLAAKPSR